MTRAPREWSKPRYCSTCHRSIVMRVEMLTPIPTKEAERSRWIDAAMRECEALFQMEHAVTCGRKAT